LESIKTCPTIGSSQKKKAIASENWLPETNNTVPIPGPATPQPKEEASEAEAEAAYYWGSLFKEDGKQESEPMLPYLMLSIYIYHVSKGSSSEKRLVQNVDEDGLRTGGDQYVMRAGVARILAWLSAPPIYVARRTNWGDELEFGMDVIFGFYHDDQDYE